MPSGPAANRRGVHASERSMIVSFCCFASLGQITPRSTPFSILIAASGHVVCVSDSIVGARCSELAFDVGGGEDVTPFPGCGDDPHPRTPAMANIGHLITTRMPSPSRMT